MADASTANADQNQRNIVRNCRWRFVPGLNDVSGVANLATKLRNAAKGFFQPLHARVGMNEQQIKELIHALANFGFVFFLRRAAHQNIAQAANDLQIRLCAPCVRQQWQQFKIEFFPAKGKQLN